ncbi:MAG: bifunctional oligoribonuclease/PAP phosphatase NrnA [Bacteroidales bacterium]|nr:bifunctional oligoribonuclease/PAP phosphatase NrnA [Bacteroidales bacterium]
MEILNHSVDYFRKLVSEPAETLIVSHHNPDGDTLGASLALYHFLKHKNHNVKVLTPNDPPSFLKWMPGVENMLVFSEDEKAGLQLLRNADLIFCMDFNSTSRVKFFAKELSESAATKVMIDHHPYPENEFDLSISVTEVSSTSELLFHLMDVAGYSSDMNVELAECLFTGIMTDTGSYSYSCNRPETFSITSRLISLGINVEKIHRLVYDTYSENRMRLLGHCLSSRMKVLPEYSTAYIWLTKEDLENYDYQPGDTEGVVNYALSIEGITFAALFTQRDDRVRISLRSKGKFPVNEFARNHFLGGGHRNAAGADSMDTIENTLLKFETLLIDYKNSIVSSQV